MVAVAGAVRGGRVGAWRAAGAGRSVRHAGARSRRQRSKGVGEKKAGAVKGRHGAEARIPSHGRMAVRGRHGAEARTPLARSRGGMAGPRRSARLARRHPRRSERIAGHHTASVRQKPSFKPRPPPAPGWLGRGWYRAEIVGHRGPPRQYRVKWTGWKKTSWVDAADVTPLAINAYRQQPLPEMRLYYEPEDCAPSSGESAIAADVAYDQGLRPHMEDRHLVNIACGRYRLCGVFDGSPPENACAPVLWTPPAGAVAALPRRRASPCSFVCDTCACHRAACRSTDPRCGMPTKHTGTAGRRQQSSFKTILSTVCTDICLGTTRPTSRSTRL